MDMYKQPPKHSQFKPGQSGNPRGRPRRLNKDFMDLTSRFFEAVMNAKAGKPNAIIKINQIRRILHETKNIPAKNSGRTTKTKPREKI